MMPGLAPPTSDPDLVRKAAFALAQTEHLEPVLGWIIARSDQAKLQVLKPSAGLDGLIEAERHRGAWIALESLVFAIRGLIEARKKDIENERDREFRGEQPRSSEPGAGAVVASGERRFSTGAAGFGIDLDG